MWPPVVGRARGAHPPHCSPPPSKGSLFQCPTASVPISFLSKDLLASLICVTEGAGRHSCSRVDSKFQSDTDERGMAQGSNGELSVPLPSRQLDRYGLRRQHCMAASISLDCSAQ